jgi:hypothetical protein
VRPSFWSASEIIAVLQFNVSKQYAVAAEAARETQVVDGVRWIH